MAFVLLVSRSAIPLYVNGEGAQIYKSPTGTTVLFHRTRSALASAEYERCLVVKSNGGKTARFQLPIDGGDRGNVKVSKHAGTSGHVFIGIWDSPKSLDYLVDIETLKAYSVLYFNSELETLPQYFQYQDSFTNDGGVWASSKAELAKYDKKVLLLDELIDLEGVDLGTLFGDTGALKFKSEATVSSSSPGKTGY